MVPQVNVQYLCIRCQLQIKMFPVVIFPCDISNYHQFLEYHTDGLNESMARMTSNRVSQMEKFNWNNMFLISSYMKIVSLCFRFFLLEYNVHKSLQYNEKKIIEFGWCFSLKVLRYSIFICFFCHRFWLTDCSKQWSSSCWYQSDWVGSR